MAETYPAKHLIYLINQIDIETLNFTRQKTDSIMKIRLRGQRQTTRNLYYSVV